MISPNVTMVFMTGYSYIESYSFSLPRDGYARKSAGSIAMIQRLITREAGFDNAGVGFEPMPSAIYQHPRYW